MNVCYYNFTHKTGAIVTPLIFCMLLLFGAYFVLNLILAVLGDSFDEMMVQELAQLELVGVRKKIAVEVARLRRRLHIMAKKQREKRKLRLAKEYHDDKAKLAFLHAHNLRAHALEREASQAPSPTNPMLGSDAAYV